MCAFVARHRNPFLTAFELTSKGGGVANCLEVDLGSPENQVVNLTAGDFEGGNSTPQFERLVRRNVDEETSCRHFFFIRHNGTNLSKR